MNVKKCFKKIMAFFLAVVIIISIMPSNRLFNYNAEASSDDPIVIVIDPGHGGSDSGAVYYRSSTDIVRESVLNWNISTQLKAYLQQYENVVVYMTKSSLTEESSLSGRVDFVESVKADLCVSIHINSGAPDARGVEVYYSRVEPFQSNTYQMAREICNNIAGIGTINRGPKTWRSTIASTPDDDYLTMICGPVSVGIPSLLIEHGFIGNDKDRYLMENFPQKYAEADGKAIVNYFHLKKKGEAEWGNPTIETTPYMQSYGFMATQPDGLPAGFLTYRKGDHRDKRMEGFMLALNNDGISGDIVYQAYIEGKEWGEEVKNGAFAGTHGEGKMIEGLKVKLTGQMDSQYDVYYRVNTGNSGWLGWAKNGAPAGKVGFNSKVRAIQVKLVSKGGPAPGPTANAFVEIGKAPAKAKIAYATHIQSFGWEKSEAYDGKTSGTTGLGKRLEGIKIRNNSKHTGDVMYQVHCQTYGWMNWAKNGEIAGTVGEGKRLEAIRIKLNGELEEVYDVYYRVHAQSFGWLDWAKNGEAAGTSGYGKRLEAIEIKYVKKGSKAPGDTDRPYVAPLVSYRTHVQTYGWQSDVKDGEVSGTSGQAKRLEGIIITNTSGIEGNFEYSVHCQTYGWMDPVIDGQMAGTSGEAKRLEAIKIDLTGKLKEKYDIYYRVHAQTYGWLDWACNGQEAGTAGLAKRLEAIQIVLVPKGGKAPGDTENCYIDGTSSYYMKKLVPSTNTDAIMD